MTANKPDPFRWFFSEIKPRDIVVVVVVLAGTYTANNVRYANMEQEQVEQTRQIAELNREMLLKMDKEVYATDQQAIRLQLRDIGDTLHGINQYLLDHPRERP